MAEEKNPNATPDSPEAADATNAESIDQISDAAKISPVAPASDSPAAGENLISADTADVIKENIVSTSEDTASTLPSANKPDLDATGPGSTRAAETPESDANVKSAGIEKTDLAADKPARAKPAAKAEGEEKPAKAKKEKPPALEDKPFADFINQNYLPSLQKTLSNQGLKDLDLKFEQRVLPIKGMEDTNCWQVIGHWSGGKQFIIGFTQEDINAAKVFCCADYGAKPSLLESFMIDERRVNLDLLLLYTVQRLNGEKWLARN